MSSSTFQLLPAMRALDALTDANRLAAGDVHGAARNAGRRAMMHLAEALGLGEAERALIDVLLTAVEGQGSLTDYDLAHLRGDIRFERDGVARILPLAELRKLIRLEARP